jgi:hypothetical protein
MQGNTYTRVEPHIEDSNKDDLGENDCWNKLEVSQNERSLINILYEVYRLKGQL